MTSTVTPVLFPISDVERLSGIKAHTLRTWESRHAMLQPTRNSTGSRFYSLHQLHQILLLALLNRNGYRISSLAKLSLTELEEKAARLHHDDDQQQMAVIRLLLCMHDFNQAGFEEVLQSCFNRWAVPDVVEEILFPFLSKTGLLWQGSRLTEEHLVVTTIRKKLLGGIDAITPDLQHAKKVVLFLPDARQLDLGLLYFYFRLKHAGVQVVYMGSDVTVDNLRTICQKTEPHYLYTYLATKSKFALHEAHQIISSQHPNTQLIFSRPMQEKAEHIEPFVKQMDFAEALQFLSAA